MAMMTVEKLPERQEIEALLPWHAAGTLSPREARRVEDALARDASLAAWVADAKSHNAALRDALDPRRT